MDRVIGHSYARSEDEALWAPGTVRLRSVENESSSKVILHPVPSSDPNDPLNWSTMRKAVNMTLLCFYVLWTFVQLDIGYTAWDPMQDELGFTTDEMNTGAALNYGGLAIGCVLFIPIVHKFGRRPLYLFSSAVQLGSAVWFAITKTNSDLLGSNIISGLSGAISETIVQITIADIFFVHQHATMIGLYLLCVAVGAYLGPVASGYITESQGWRWMWWWCVIFLSINLLLVIFLFEESKYIPATNGHGMAESLGSVQSKDLAAIDKTQDHAKVSRDANPVSEIRTHSRVDRTITPKTYRQRLAFVTYSQGSIWQHFYQPFIILFTFPAITYAAITYGTVLSSFAILTSEQATYLPLAPYNFSPAGVGLMNIAPFIGGIPGFVVGGYLSDKSITWLARRNRGIYEPEMRLWLVLLAAIVLPIGVLMTGVGLARNQHWSVLAIGFGLYGFAFVLTGDIALAYATDCYQDIIGDALVGIIFFRNLLPLVVLFVLTPWTNAMGVQNVSIITAVVSFVILLLPLALLKWGKRVRIWTAKRYRTMALRQPVHRIMDEHRI